MQVYETNDLSHLLKRGKVDRFAYKAYDLIQDQLIDAFGVSEDYKRIISDTIRIEEMYARQIKTGDTSNQLLIEVAEAELEAAKNKPKHGDFFEAIVYIEKSMQIRVNSKELNVFEFYKYCQVLSKQAQEANKKTQK